MPIEAIGKEPYEYVPAEQEEPKTVFVMKPLSQWEAIRTGGKYLELLEDLDIESESDKMELVKYFGSDDAEEIINMLKKFMEGHVLEVRNIKLNGKMKTILQKDFDVDMIPPMVSFEVMADAISRTQVTGKERKN